MSDTSFTPGPWKWSQHYGDCGDLFWQLDGEGQTVLDGERGLGGVDLADATLIAAAPDMLMALIGLKVIAEQYLTDLAAEIQEGRLSDHIWKLEVSRWSAVEAAIAKATGAQP